MIRPTLAIVAVALLVGCGSTGQPSTNALLASPAAQASQNSLLNAFNSAVTTMTNPILHPAPTPANKPGAVSLAANRAAVKKLAARKTPPKRTAITKTVKPAVSAPPTLLSRFTP